VRAVVPILRSGGYIVPTRSLSEGNAVSVSPGGDPIGYETDYYDVRSRNGSEIAIAFTRGEAVEQGKTSRRTEPRVQLLSLSTRTKFVRLVYLTARVRLITTWCYWRQAMRILSIS
jgi:hypothetical protein